jgi:hypothetical protein
MDTPYPSGITHEIVDVIVDGVVDMDVDGDGDNPVYVAFAVYVFANAYVRGQPE